MLKIARIATAAFMAVSPLQAAEMVNGVNISVYPGTTDAKQATVFWVTCQNSKPKGVIVMQMSEAGVLQAMREQQKETPQGTVVQHEGQQNYMVFADRDGKFRPFNDKYEIEGIFQDLASGKLNSGDITQLNLNRVAHQAHAFCGPNA